MSPTVKKPTEKRTIFALFLVPLLVPAALLISTRLQSTPVFKAPTGAEVLVSRRNPFSKIAGPIYFERLASSKPYPVFWKQMQLVFRGNRGVDVSSELEPMNGNYLESRNHHEDSFKVLGVPQIEMREPGFRGGGNVRGANLKIFLWADGSGGSVMELWVMDAF
jgi:hypothetical protein